MQTIIRQLHFLFPVKSLHFLLISFFVIFITLTNYQLAKLVQKFILNFVPNFSYIWSLSLPWLLIAMLPIFAFKTHFLSMNPSLIRKNLTALTLYTTIILLGLSLFWTLGLTSYFHSVKYPLIFFLVTPIVEELIFRGWIYEWAHKFTKWNPVFVTAVLFGLHHWQYFGYRFTPFGVFQMSYTFVLGLLFGKIRQKSGNVYFSMLLHILINFVSYAF